jgi:hypothetical protein
MGTFKGTVDRNEPDDKEVAYFVPSWHDDDILAQSIAIAPLHDNETSIIFYQMHENMNMKSSDYIHFIFTEEETNMLLNALLAVKKRWKTGNVIK